MDTSAAKQGLFSFLQLPGSYSDGVNGVFSCHFHLGGGHSDGIRTKDVFQFQPFKGIANESCLGVVLTAAQMTA